MHNPFRAIFPDVARPLIGMLHAPPLPGAPAYDGNWRHVRDFVRRDAESLAKGVDALMLENFHDAPFFPRRVPRHVVAHLTVLASDIRRATDLPLGVNVLRNDGASAIAIASAAGADFVRVNVLSGARVTDQGVIESAAHQVLRLRRTLGANGIAIVADVDVKHSAPLGAPTPLPQAVADLTLRSRADALVVSGVATGAATDPAALAEVKSAAADIPVLIGSGVTADTLARLAAADGYIVGASLKRDGLIANPVDPRRVAALRAARDDLP